MKDVTGPSARESAHASRVCQTEKMGTQRREIRRCLQWISGVAGLAVTVLFVATSTAAVPYANPRLLIETEELAGLLGDPALRIVDLRRDAEKGEEAFRAGHLPGAVYLAAGELDDSEANAKGFPIPPDKAAELFGHLGVDQETPVVAYDDGGSRLAARLFFVLEYYGHTRTRVLNGGIDKWRMEGRPLEFEVMSVTPKRFEPRARREVLATAEEVKAALLREDVCLIDVRTAREFTGEDARAERGGHIPGAANLEWTTALNPDQTFKSAEALRAAFEEAGVRADR